MSIHQTLNKVTTNTAAAWPPTAIERDTMMESYTTISMGTLNTIARPFTILHSTFNNDIKSPHAHTRVGRYVCDHCVLCGVRAVHCTVCTHNSYKERNWTQTGHVCTTQKGLN